MHSGTHYEYFDPKRTMKKKPKQYYISGFVGKGGEIIHFMFSCHYPESSVNNPRKRKKFHVCRVLFSLSVQLSEIGPPTYSTASEFSFASPPPFGSRGETHSIAGEGEPNSDKGTDTLVFLFYTLVPLLLDASL